MSLRGNALKSVLGSAIFVTFVLIYLGIRKGSREGAPNVVTQAYDNARSGVYPFETSLTPASLSSGRFGKLYERAVDGDIQAQPLYVRGVTVPGVGQKDLVFVASSKNKIYAFDADNLDPNPAQGVIWSRQINTSRKLIVGTTEQGGEICSETFDGFVGITSTPVIDPASNSMYVVTWRAPLADMNLFVASQTGAVQFSGWLGPALGYHPWSSISPDSFVAADQPVSAVWRDLTHLDVFVVARDGGVYTSWWEAEKGGQSWNWVKIGQSGLATPGQQVTPVWINGTQLSLYITAADGSIQTTQWTVTSGWQSWSIIDTAGSASPGQPVAALASSTTHLDLFITASDGSIRTNFWELASGWHNWYQIGPSGNAAPIQPVTAIGNIATQLSLYITAADGSIQTTQWTAASGWQSWSIIDTAGSASPGQPVAALASSTTHLDLFITASDGSIRTNFWELASGWHSWYQIGPSGNAAPIQPVTAIGNIATQLSLYITAADGSIQTTQWTAASGWGSWSMIGTGDESPPRQLVTTLLPNVGYISDTGGNYLHSIDITTGQEKPNSPVKIQAASPANPNVILDPRCHRNRPGLLLLNGVVYIGFSCLSCDRWCSENEPFRGWVLGYNAATMAQVAVFTTSPNQAAAGIWQSGSGLVADSSGSIYFETGNGEPPDISGAPPLDDSFIKLQTPALQVLGSYSPSNAQALRCGDTDLGSGGPVLIDGNKLLGGGKEGKFYLIDTASMTVTQQFQAFQNTWYADSTQPPCAGPNPPWFTCKPPFPKDPPGATPRAPCYVDPSRYQDWQPFGPNIHGAPVVWTISRSGDVLIYKMAEKDFLKAYRFNHAANAVNTTPAAVAAVRPPDGMPGGFSSLSSNDISNGIVWTSFPEADATSQAAPGRFVAFDATTLSELWEDDTPVAFAKFTPSTIVDGKVYRPTFANKIVVYGLSSGSMSPTCSTIDQVYQNFGGPNGILGVPTGKAMITGDGLGQYRDYHGHALGGFVSVLPSRAPQPSADPDHPTFLARTDIDASIYSSPSTCAHVVLGQIRALWLSLGAEKGALGYPTSDEVHTPDEHGRRSRFQHGEIWWYPERGAFVNNASQH